MKRLFTLFTSLALTLSLYTSNLGQLLAQSTSATNIEFGYADRSVAPIGIGIPKTGRVALAIKLPKMGGNTITSLSLFIAGDDEVITPSIFIADADDRQIKYFEKTTLHKGWNTVELKAPFVLQDDINYYVGYQIQAKSKTKPLGFESSVTGRIIGTSFIELGGYYSAVGAKTNLVEVVDPAAGNALIYAHITDRSGVLKRVAHPVEGSRFTAEELKPNQPNELLLKVRNLGTEVINSLSVQTQYSGQEKKQQILTGLNISPGKTAEIKMSSLAPRRGLGTYHSTLTSVNGHKQTLEYITQSIPYRVHTPGGSWGRTSYLIEKFTSEQCTNCPSSDRLLENLVKEMQEEGAEVSVIAHHAGHDPDPFSLSGSERIALYAYGHSSFAPALMINRLADDRYKQNLAGSFNDRISKYKKAQAIEQVAHITSLSARGHNGAMTLEIKGETGYIDPENLLLTAVLTEDDVKAVRQAGANADYYHKHLVRDFLTPEYGTPIELQPDGSFSIELKNIGYDNSWNEANLKVVAVLHKNIQTPNLTEREVYAAKTASWSTLTNLESPLEASRLYITSRNGWLQLSDAVDELHIYDITGRLIANSTAVRLHPGVYLVRVSQAGIYTIHKVIVE